MPHLVKPMIKNRGKHRVVCPSPIPPKHGFANPGNRVPQNAVGGEDAAADALPGGGAASASRASRRSARRTSGGCFGRTPSQ